MNRLDSNSYVTESTPNTRREKPISEDDTASSSHDSALASVSLWPPIASMNAKHSTEPSNAARPIRVAIIGGSYAGMAAARELDAVAEQYNLHITVIEPRTHLFFNIGFPRSIVIDISRLCFVPTDNVFASGRVHHCRTRALHLERRHVVLEQWTEEQEVKYRKEESKHADGGNVIQSRIDPPPAAISYDYAIVAAGSYYPPPMKLAVESIEEGVRDLAQVRAAVQRSPRILVVGGGPSGVEVASEIKYYHPDKEVTIIHNTDQLVDRLTISRKVHHQIERSLRHLGVKIRLKEVLLLTEAQRLRGFIEETCVYTTNLGDAIETDLLVSSYYYNCIRN
jgi:NADH dehydrogenase FAD-containing subunit